MTRDESRGSGRCPVCGQPAEHRFRPFCSRRCADVDLGRWLGGAYRIPAKEEDEGDGTPPAEAEDTEGDGGDGGDG